MNDSSASHTTTVLIILDGFGHRVETADNAIAHASTPTWDRLWRERPHTLVSTSGLDVGLPEGQMGNSEVGHMSLGSGRIIYQSMTRIDQAIADGTFATNPVFLKAVDDAVRAGRAVLEVCTAARHIYGRLSGLPRLAVLIASISMRFSTAAIRHRVALRHPLPQPRLFLMRLASDDLPVSTVATGLWIAISAGIESRRVMLY